MMGRLLRLVLMALLAVQWTAIPASASDFSPMAEPPFSRIAFLSMERRLEIMCVHYSAFASRNGKGVTPTESLTLASAVTARLETELGSRKWAIEMIELSDYADTQDEKADRDARYAGLAPKCAPLFSALRAGTLSAELAPLEGSPIALPDVETCLAFDLLAQKLDPPAPDNLFGKSGGTEMRSVLLGRTPEDRAARSQRVATLAVGLAATPRERIELIVSLGCIYPMIIEYRRLYPNGEETPEVGDEDADYVPDTAVTEDE